MRRFVTAAFGLATLGYGGAAAYLKVYETDLVFHPAERVVAEPSASLALNQREVWYASGDGIRLNAWIVPARSADSTGYWLLVNHGNYGNIGYGDRPLYYSYARDIGLNLFAYDYRGFGASEGEPDEEGLYADALASWHYLTDSLGVDSDHIIIFGHSLGSGVAVELASRVQSAGLVVEGAYTSVPDRGQELYPWLPVKLIAGQRFASIDKIGSIAMPKVFLHSPSDDVIPFAHGERLFEAASGPKVFVSVRGGHMDAFKDDREAYFGAIRTLVESLRGGPPGGHGADVR